MLTALSASEHLFGYCAILISFIHAAQSCVILQQRLYPLSVSFKFPQKLTFLNPTLCCFFYEDFTLTSLFNLYLIRSDSEDWINVHTGLFSSSICSEKTPHRHTHTPHTHTSMSLSHTLTRKHNSPASFINPPIRRHTYTHSVSV